MPLKTGIPVLQGGEDVKLNELIINVFDKERFH